ncbi:MAG: helix-turn-helix transcriptional regulator [Selenomonadaceae bacterium]|nr:helix-turn-helix transcriptional regulator [Selenomonadaceae bacterium]
MNWKNMFHRRINELWERAKDENYKLTLENYAERIGTTRSALRGWLAGKGQPDADGFVRVASLEGVSLEWLLGAEKINAATQNRENELISKFKNLSKIHQEDILYMLDRFYNQDKTASNKG